MPSDSRTKYLLSPAWRFVKTSKTLHRWVTAETVNGAKLPRDLLFGTDRATLARVLGAKLLKDWSARGVIVPTQQKTKKRKPHIKGNPKLVSRAMRLLSQTTPAWAAPLYKKAQAVELTGFGQNVFAFRPAADGCAKCLMLRASGAVSEVGRSKIRDPWKQGILLSPEKQTALVFEALESLANAKGVNSAAWAALGIGVESGAFQPHPDCPTCNAYRAPNTLKNFKQALLSKGPTPVRTSSLQTTFDSPFSPMEIEEDIGPKGKFPLNLPFVWGSVNLVRYSNGGGTRSTSTWGGIFGAGFTPDLCRRVAFSEGAERIEARSISSEKYFSKRPARAIHMEDCGVRETFSKGHARKRKRGYVQGYDLVTMKATWVSTDAVAVGLPRTIEPHVAYVENFYTGCASHTNLKKAITNATLEVLHRDAFITNWYRMTTLRAVEIPNRLDSPAKELQTYFSRHGIRIDPYELPNPYGLPFLMLHATATRTVGNWKQGGAMLISCGSFQARDSYTHGLRFLSGQFASHALYPAALKDPTDPEAVRKMSQNVAFWPGLAYFLAPERASQLALPVAPQSISLDDLGSRENRTDAGRMSYLKQTLRKLDRPWVAIRLTGAVANAAGFEVAKVVIPRTLRLARHRSNIDRQSVRITGAWPAATGNQFNTLRHPMY